MTCQDFFETHALNKDKCKSLQKEASRYDWQQQVASKYSPGPVLDEEKLLRQVFNPIHLQPGTNNLKPTALDDFANKGLSVNRLEHSSLQAVVDIGMQKAVNDTADPERTDKNLIGIIELVTTDVRTIKDSQNTHGLGVYDTALENDQSHADVCLLVEGKSNFRSIRSKLLDLAQSNFKLINN